MSLIRPGGARVLYLVLEQPSSRSKPFSELVHCACGQVLLASIQTLYAHLRDIADSGIEPNELINNL